MQSIGKIFIDNTSEREVDYYLERDINLILDKSIKEITYDYDINLYDKRAPLKRNDVIGVLTLHYLDNDYDYNIIVKDDIKKSNYFRILINNLKDIISGNFKVFL